MVTLTVATGVLVCCATAIGLLLFFERPVVTRDTMLSTLPWLFLATLLQAIRGTINYPSVVESAFAFPWILLLVGSLWGSAWLLVTQFVNGEQPHRRVARLLGLIGVGAVVAPFSITVATYGADVPMGRLLAWAITPVLACLITYVMLASLWVLLPRTATFAGFTGALLLFGLALHAIVVALAVAYGEWTSPPLLVAATERLAVALAVSETLALVWILVGGCLLAAVAAIVVCALLKRWHTVLGQRGFDVATVLSVVIGSNTFVVALVQGVVV